VHSQRILLVSLGGVAGVAPVDGRIVVDGVDSRERVRLSQVCQKCGTCFPLGPVLPNGRKDLRAFALFLDQPKSLINYFDCAV